MFRIKNILTALFLAVLLCQYGLADSASCDDMPCCSGETPVQVVEVNSASCCDDVIVGEVSSGGCECSLSEQNTFPKEPKTTVISSQNIELAVQELVALVFGDAPTLPKAKMKPDWQEPDRSLTSQLFVSCSAFPNPPPSCS